MEKVDHDEKDRVQQSKCISKSKKLNERSGTSEAEREKETTSLGLGHESGQTSKWKKNTILRRLHCVIRKKRSQENSTGETAPNKTKT